MFKKSSSVLVFSSLSLFLIACGPSGSVESILDDNPNENQSQALTVTVERGPVFGATVKDSKGQVAISIPTKLNTYQFSSTPTYPITVTGGTVDVNYDGVNDASTNTDRSLDITMSSYSNIVSPLTTYIGNDSSKLNYLINTYNLTENQIKNTVPSEVSNETIVLANTIYKLIDAGTTLTQNAIDTEYAIILSTLTQSCTNVNLLERAKCLEDTIYDSLLKAPIAQNQNEIETLSLTNSTFSKVNKTSDKISDIWNLAIAMDEDQTISDFDIAISILKKSSGTIGNITIEGLSISNNTLSFANKVTIFGTKTNGTTSKIVYDNTKDITKNAITLSEYSNAVLYINLGYIINNQEVVDASSFTAATDYELDIYFTKINTNNLKTDETIQIQTSYDGYYSVPTNSDVITGTIKVEN